MSNRQLAVGITFDCNWEKAGEVLDVIKELPITNHGQPLSQWECEFARNSGSFKISRIPYLGLDTRLETSVSLNLSERHMYVGPQIVQNAIHAFVKDRTQGDNLPSIQTGQLLLQMPYGQFEYARLAIIHLIEFATGLPYKKILHSRVIDFVNLQASREFIDSNRLIEREGVSWNIPNAAKKVGMPSIEWHQSHATYMADYLDNLDPKYRRKLLRSLYYRIICAGGIPIERDGHIRFEPIARDLLEPDVQTVIEDQYANHVKLKDIAGLMEHVKELESIKVAFDVKKDEVKQFLSSKLNKL